MAGAAQRELRRQMTIAAAAHVAGILTRPGQLRGSSSVAERQPPVAVPPAELGVAGQEVAVPTFRQRLHEGRRREPTATAANATAQEPAKVVPGPFGPGPLPVVPRSVGPPPEVGAATTGPWATTTLPQQQPRPGCIVGAYAVIGLASPPLPSSRAVPAACRLATAIVVPCG